MNKTNIRHFSRKLAVLLMRAYIAMALAFAVLTAVSIVIGVIGIGGFLAAKALRLF